MNRNTIFSTFAAYCFVALFIYASFSKILDFELFQIQIAQSPLLSAYAGFISYAVVGIELIIAAMLLTEKFKLKGLYASTALMTGFTVYIYLILNYSEFVPCSCGGVLEKMTWEQHLIFNIAFTFLGATAVVIAEQKNHRHFLKTIMKLLIINFFSSAMIIVMFQTSEYTMTKRNNFVRRYLPHPIEEVASKMLDEPGYEISGTDSERIILYNPGKPFAFLSLDLELVQVRAHNLILPSNEVRYKNPKLRYRSSHLYFLDGTAPVIMKGTDEKLHIKDMNQFYFDKIIITKDDAYVFRSISSQSKQNVIGFYRANHAPIFYPDILKKKTDGVFDTDGELLYDESTNSIVYLYRYNNNYNVIRQNVMSVKTGKTIDNSIAPTITSLKTSKGENKVAHPIIAMNKTGLFYRGLLFIQSGNIGRFEEKEAWKNSAVLDVYDTYTNNYIGSIYVPIKSKKKDISLYADQDFLYIIHEKELRKYRFAQNILQHFSKVEAEKP